MGPFTKPGTEVRAGWFRIDWYVLTHQPELAKVILRDCLVIKAWHDRLADQVEYIALGSQFPLMLNGVVCKMKPIVHETRSEEGPPEYRVEWV